MKYRTVKMGEVMPRNTETFNGFNWEQYYGEYDYIETEADLHCNHVIPEDLIRVPIEESEVVE